MIKGKYQITDILKEFNSKKVERVLLNGESAYIMKSYPVSDAQSIQNEINVYHKLKDPHLHGILQIKEAFEENGRIYLCFQEVGENLDYLRKKCGGRFTLKTTLMIGLQMLERIEKLHSNGILHADIKPNNFLVGKSKLRHKIYIVDFELSSSFKKDGKHILPQTTESFSGSLIFSSTASNSKQAISRRDEIESLIYCMIYFLKGTLPWCKLSAKTVQEAYQEAGQLKVSKRKELLEGLPEIFGKVLEMVKELKFDEEPNYKGVRSLIAGQMKKNGYELDYKYDWEYI